MRFPGGKTFAFTIVDDTDHATVENVRPVYDLLAELGFRTTKTVWVWPPRDQFTGQCLQDADYLDFVRDLLARGFEIGLHNVGSGSFNRDEILAGIEEFQAKLGFYPSLHVNHVTSRDNLYWSPSVRFSPPLDTVYRMLTRVGGLQRNPFSGEQESSPHFWGDAAKKHIKYIRNFTFNGINTLAYDPMMPYRDPKKSKYSNLWFSSSDGHTAEEFTSLLHSSNVDQLAGRGGVCIVYTHFASGFVKNGEVTRTFRDRLDYLAGKGGWYVPASTLLDHLLSQKSAVPEATAAYLFKLNARWMWDRLRKRVKFGR